MLMNIFIVVITNNDKYIIKYTEIAFTFFNTVFFIFCFLVFCRKFLGITSIDISEDYPAME